MDRKDIYTILFVLIVLMLIHMEFIVQKKRALESTPPNARTQEEALKTYTCYVCFSEINIKKIIRKAIEKIESTDTSNNE